MDNNFSHDDDSPSREEILQLVQDYENMQANGDSRFWPLDSLLDIIDYYDEELRTEDALQAAIFAAQQHPFDPMPYIRQSHFLLELNQLEEAHQALDKAAIYDPSHDEIPLFRAEILVRQTHYDQALQIINQIRQREDLSPEDLANVALVEAFLWETQQDYPAALDNLLFALDIDPRADATAVRLRIIMEQIQDLQPAIAPLQKITDKDPYSAAAWVLLAYAQAHTGLHAEATESFELAIAAQEDFEPAYYEYIDFLFQQQLYPQARNILQEAIEAKVFPNQAYPLYRIGECWQAENELVQAMNYYKRTLEIDNLDGYVYFQMGNLYVELGLQLEAREAYATAYQTNNQQPFFALALAQTLGRLRQQDEALEYFSIALDIQPSNTEIWAAYFAYLIEEQEIERIHAFLRDFREQHEDPTFVLYAQAALAFSQKQLQMGQDYLFLALQSDSSRYDLLFLFMPSLEQDDTVWHQINNFLPKE